MILGYFLVFFLNSLVLFGICFVIFYILLYSFVLLCVVFIYLFSFFFFTNIFCSAPTTLLGVKAEPAMNMGAQNSLRSCQKEVEYYTMSNWYYIGVILASYNTKTFECYFIDSKTTTNLTKITGDDQDDWQTYINPNTGNGICLF